MKNVMKMCMVVGVFALFAFAPVNATKTVVNPTLESTVEVCAVEEACIDNDALTCKVYNDGGQLIGKCNFCNCPEFAAALRKK